MLHLICRKFSRAYREVPLKFETRASKSRLTHKYHLGIGEHHYTTPPWTESMYSTIEHVASQQKTSISEFICELCTMRSGNLESSCRFSYVYRLRLVTKLYNAKELPRWVTATKNNMIFILTPISIRNRILGKHVRPWQHPLGSAMSLHSPPDLAHCLLSSSGAGAAATEAAKMEKMTRVAVKMRIVNTFEITGTSLMKICHL